MNTLPQNSHDVHSNPDAVELYPWDDAESDPAGWPAWTDAERWAVSDDDRAWWAVQPRDAADRAGDLSDLAFLEDEAGDWRSRAGGGDFDFAAFVGATLSGLVGSMRFHRVTKAVDLARVRRADLGRVFVPGVGSRRSALAAALDAEASYYLHLDTDAGRLAAHAIERHADLAEEMGSSDVENWVADEAAWRAAAIDAVCGA